MDTTIIPVIIRSVIVYLFIIFAFRFFGKKELSQLSLVDLAFILLISNSVQNAMVGENTSLLGGIAAAATLFIINYILENLIFRSKRFREFIQGEPLMLIYHGKALPEHLTRAKISHEELLEAVREHGVKDIQEVNLAVLETDGNISVLSNNYTHQTVRKRRAHKVLTKEE